jgi:threonine/homoserine/homoserine lactone efflux protein
VLTLESWLAAAGVCALGAISPGPSLAVVVAFAGGRSRAAGLACAWAHAAGIGVHAGLSVGGLAAVIAANPALYRAVALAGAGDRMGLGVEARRGGAPRGEGRAAAGPRGTAAGMRDGFTIALVNPKIVVFFLALFSQFVDSSAGPGALCTLAVTAIVIDGAWYSAVALAISGAGLQSWLRARARGLDRTTGALLLAVAAWTIGRYLAVLA